MDLFLRKASEVFELAVFTASVAKYANAVLNKLDPRGLIKHRLFREHCVVTSSGLVKDLSQLGRKLKDVMILDNSPVCYALQPFNAVPIKTWIDDKNDKQLEELWPVLQLLSKVSDVRTHLKQVVKENQIDCKAAVNYLRSTLEDTQRAAREPQSMLMTHWIATQPLTSRNAEVALSNEAKANKLPVQRRDSSQSSRTAQLKDVRKLLHERHCAGSSRQSGSCKAERRLSQKDLGGRRGSLKNVHEDSAKENSQYVYNSSDYIKRLMPNTARNKQEQCSNELLQKNMCAYYKGDRKPLCSASKNPVDTLGAYKREYLRMQVDCRQQKPKATPSLWKEKLHSLEMSRNNAARAANTQEKRNTHTSATTQRPTMLHNNSAPKLSTLRAVKGLRIAYH